LGVDPIGRVERSGLFQHQGQQDCKKTHDVLIALG
jgi:hypothetical protein